MFGYPPSPADKTYLITFGVRQAIIVNETANKEDKTPRGFIIDSAIEACELRIAALL